MNPSNRPDGNPEEDDQENNDQEISMEEEQEEANTDAPSPDSSSQVTPNTGSDSKGSKKPRRSKNSPEPDYSAMVQEQMSSTNRTGQACDRCKGRKMKCDSNPTGCANCIASESVCTQTDPITRVSSIRGELERLRQDCQTLRQENHDLRQALNHTSEIVRAYRYANQNEHPGTFGSRPVQGQHTAYVPAAQGYANAGNGISGAGSHVPAAGIFPMASAHYRQMQGRAPNGHPYPNNPGMGFPPMAPPPQAPPQSHPQPQQQQQGPASTYMPGPFTQAPVRPSPSASPPSSNPRQPPQLGRPINFSGDDDDEEEQKYEGFNPHQHFPY